MFVIKADVRVVERTVFLCQKRHILFPVYLAAVLKLFKSIGILGYFTLVYLVVNMGSMFYLKTLTIKVLFVCC